MLFPEYLQAILIFGFATVKMNLEKAIKCVQTTGKGRYIFQSCLFFVDSLDFSESIFPCFQNCFQHTDLKQKYQPTKTVFLKMDKPERLSVHTCQRNLLTILSILGPYIQNRRTNITCVVFDFSYDVNITFHGCTNITDDGKRAKLTFNMLHLKSDNFFVNTALHEIAHLLVPPTIENLNHTNEFFHVYTCLLHILKTNTTHFSEITFLQPAIFTNIRN
jgi:hypothetical protein